MDKLAAMLSAVACAILKAITCPHKNFVTSGLPMQNRIQQNFGVVEAHPTSLFLRAVFETLYEKPRLH